MAKLCQLTIFAGSTGKPKGVDVSHRNVTNALLLEPANLGITIGSKVAQVLNIAFDMGAWEILACLMNGGTLHLRSSSWEETLSEVGISSNVSNISANKSGRHIHINTLYLVQVSTQSLSQHPNRRHRRRTLSSIVSLLRLFTRFLMLMNLQISGRVG